MIDNDASPFKPCVSKPCPDCAFTRSAKPGALGGSPPEVYIGQAHGPFHVPCHMQYGDRASMDQVKAEAENIHQCAGMAVFRANLGMNPHLPDELGKLPEDKTLVFASAAEFLAHHKRISLYRAMQELSVNPPAKLLRECMARAGNRVFLLRKEDK